MLLYHLMTDEGTLPDKVIEKRWLVDATIEKRRFLHDGEWWNYPIISNSVWSDAPAYSNPAFQEKILSLTKKWLEQN